jgi:hypothetical protein
LHPFFLGTLSSSHFLLSAFKDQSPGSEYISVSALPVVSNNDYCPIVNPIRGGRCGFLKVLLGMGSEKQIMTFTDILHATKTIQR